ncbi:40S ribosomal protein S3 [Culex quinquefasciatus]|uniref:40S ribosomal protein S3 n=1 Tax=Culex quinquefasciatus TaxID=7176 RepID=B0X7L7_CULQU|nr:40S ribosomal protein S3 [Culex quinquefasciatus]|eukprot:XP_001865639.1 40S ribosomal protein S3 [Culex quinquefasciatus]
MAEKYKRQIIVQQNKTVCHFFLRSGSSFSAWLAEDGLSGVEVRVTPTRTEFIIMASAPRTCSARSDHRIRELNAVIYGVLRFIMESCAKGYEVVVSGKLRGQRAKSMTFVDGMMIHSDDPCKEATPLRQGELGIQVKIVLPWDPNGNIGPKELLSDNVEMVEPKDEIMYNTPRSEPKNK